MENEVHIVFRGTLDEMMVAADPALYRSFVSYETGKAVLYVRLRHYMAVLKAHCCFTIS